MPRKLLIPLVLLLGAVLTGCRAHQESSTAGILPPGAQRYALIIGVEKYRDPAVRAVAAAVLSANRTASALEADANFPSKNVRVLSSNGKEKPTRANILAEIDQLAHKAKAGDLVFIYFDGHGINLEGQSYLFPWDVNKHSQDALGKTMLGTETIKEAVNKIPCRTALLFIEACRNDHSALLKKPLATPALSAPLTLPPGGPRSTVTFYSSTMGQATWSGHSQGGYVSQYLKRGLQGAAADGDGIVRVKNLLQYLCKAVYGRVELNNGLAQLPTWEVAGDKDGALDLVLALGRAPGAGGTTAVVRTPHMTSQENYVAAMQGGYEARLAKDDQTAQSRFEEALRYKPGSIRATCELAFAAMHSNQNDERVEPLFRECVAKNPRSDYANVMYGWYLAGTKHEYAKAQPYFLRAAALSPRSSAPLSYLAIISRLLHRPAEASKYFHRAMKLPTANGWEHARFAYVLMKEGNRQAAVKEARLARRLDSSLRFSFFKELGVK